MTWKKAILISLIGSILLPLFLVFIGLIEGFIFDRSIFSWLFLKKILAFFIFMFISVLIGIVIAAVRGQRK